MKIINQKRLENSKENGTGTASTVNGPFFTKNKEKEMKRVLYTKFLIALLLTNTLTFLLLSEKPKEIIAAKKAKDDLNTKIMTMTLKLFVPLSNIPQVVSLYDSENNKVIESITIIKIIDSSSEHDEEAQNYNVRVKNKDIQNVINNRSGILYAFPITTNKSRERRIHEVSF